MKANQIRLQSQSLTNSSFTKPEEAVSWMGAIQAQNTAMAKWAVGIRMKDGKSSAVNEALESGRILRTHILRPTWHFVTPENIRWMLRLTGERIKNAVKQSVDGNNIDNHELHRCYHFLEELLCGGKSMTRTELATGLVSKGFQTGSTRRLAHLLMCAESDAIVCNGTNEGKTPTYSLLDERVPMFPALSHEEALARLATLYFQSHAPATLHDFTWWSGLPLSAAKKAIASLGEKLHKEQWQGNTYYIHTDTKTIKDRPKADVMLLPAYDESLIAYRDRSLVLHPNHNEKAFTKNGIFYPVVLYHGRVVGNWKCLTKNHYTNYEYTWFDGEEIPSETLTMLAEKRHFNYLGS